ncbi:glycosyltransferase family 2 protein [Xanthobacter sp. YC-JY1]|uniref:glycosyltransferase family 2 protein n=1 Tax=Xanthobacter sp. YC-JY1 TaxID=2419844 RepID=UPI001F41D5D2|nr:glycosyltransferase [Xanthobacter sp. YC-JY1]UJX45049.1 glycosyltransferase family 2 protein [Xanthobacter sp. YC-JY1]
MGWLSYLFRRSAPEAVDLGSSARIETDAAPAVAPPAGDAGPVWPPVLDSDGHRPVSGAGLDRVFRDGDLLVLTGWATGNAALSLEGPQGCLAPDISISVPRPDVAAAYGFAGEVQGLLLAFRPTPTGSRIVARAGEQTRAGEVAAFPPERLERDLSRILAEYAAARAQLIDLVRDLPEHLAAVARSAVRSPRPGAPQGHMEILKCVPGAGGLCVGWTLGAGPFFLVDEAGLCQPLEAPVRWNRQDIFDAFAADYGADCADAGFLQALPAGFGRTARLIARDGDTLVLLHERGVDPAPRDAVGYARWAFSFPVPPERMVERIARHDGTVLKALLNRTERASKTWVERAGTVPAEPEVSLVIPLFGRYDFVEHQLLEFADDPFIRNTCEVIYVVDDPAIRTPVFAALDTWWQLYGVPLTLVWGGRNRGFSGASNLGLSLARGRQVLFLNSDVVPMSSGWLAAMSRRLDDHPDYGLLGARLLFPSGGVQHDGMVFRYINSFGVWMNDHPGKGLPPLDATPGSVVEWPAATGACLLGDRLEVLSLGGFSESYLIGDFEDSDLCLKARGGGRRVGVCADITLTHLERQSFGFQGSGEFRLGVTLFNAWLHETRWRSDIEKFEARKSLEAGA